MININDMTEEELDQYVLKNSPASKKTYGLDVESLTAEQLDSYLGGKPIDAQESNERIGMVSSIGGA